MAAYREGSLKCPPEIRSSEMPSIQQLEKLLAADPNDAFVLYGLAQEYAKAGNTPQAVEFYDRCLAADPAYVYAYYHKARALARAGRTPEAMACVHAGKTAAKQASDGHALSELSALELELEE